jgi:hypothetical protein
MNARGGPKAARGGIPRLLREPLLVGDVEVHRVDRRDTRRPRRQQKTRAGGTCDIAVAPLGVRLDVPPSEATRSSAPHMRATTLS